MIARALRLLCGLGGSILALPSEAQDVLRVEGTEWIAHLPGDRQLRSADLVGAQLQVAGGIELRIDAATLHHDHRGQSWWSHELSMRAAGQAWQPLCAPHSDGSSFAIVLAGQETTDGMLADHPDAFALSCSRGALAKCLRLGYRPWERDGAGRPMRPVFNACIRMIRADYGGTGEPHTLEGQTIDVYDDVGVQSPDEAGTALTFEAAWREDGAVCVHHPRVPAAGALAELEARHPRLSNRGGERCTEAAGRADGALLFNRSRRSDPPTRP